MNLPELKLGAWPKIMEEAFEGRVCTQRKTQTFGGVGITEPKTRRGGTGSRSAEVEGIGNDKSNKVESKSNQVEEPCDDKSNEVECKSNEVVNSSNDKGNQVKQRPKVTNKQKDIIKFCSVPRSAQEIMDRIGIDNQKNNRKRYIQALIDMGYLKPLFAESATAPNQKYVKVSNK